MSGGSAPSAALGVKDRGSRAAVRADTSTLALLAQCVGSGLLCAGFAYCWLVQSEAAAGTAWAVEGTLDDQVS